MLPEVPGVCELEPPLSSVDQPVLTQFVVPSGTVPGFPPPPEEL